MNHVASESRHNANHPAGTPVSVKSRAGEQRLAWRCGSKGAANLPWGYRHHLIDLGTLAGLLEHHHRLGAYCQRRDRWSVLPLAELIAQDCETATNLPRALNITRSVD